MRFVPGFKPPAKSLEKVFWFLFHDLRLLIKDEGGIYSIPRATDLDGLNFEPIQKRFFGLLDEHACYAASLSEAVQSCRSLKFIGLRELFACFEADLVRAVGVANQLVLWNQNHQYCSKCGHPTEDKTDERAKICPQCGLVNYPRLSPAIIVAVLKDHQILLAHSQRFPAKFYSVLAGFVEPGETLEECVRREVQEEVGITVKNIRYFGSQPWPFPDSLMIAFTAEYAGGEICIDKAEIADAGWFSGEHLPAIPPKISIARHLIDWFSQEKQA